MRVSRVSDEWLVAVVVVLVARTLLLIASENYTNKSRLQFPSIIRNIIIIDYAVCHGFLTIYFTWAAILVLSLNRSSIGVPSLNQSHYISLEWTLDAELRALIIIAISKVVFIPIYLFDRCSMSESASLRAVVPN